MDEVLQSIEEFCKERPGSLNLRLTNGMWQAQLVANDGTFARTAQDYSLTEVLRILAVGL